MEEWKNLYINNYGVIYISNYGRVKNKNNIILKSYLNTDGYELIKISYTINKKRFFVHKKVHRLVAEQFIANPKNKPEVNHKDGNKQNNYVSNLEWCTRQENNKHASDTGLNPHPIGSKNPNAKLIEDDVIKIKELYNSGFRIYKIAQKYKVSWSTIKLIVTNKTWKNV